VEAALRSLLGRLDAELIVASGDLTHRGRRDQHERAHRFLTSFGLPVLTVPGNHDMPYTPGPTRSSLGNGERSSRRTPPPRCT
jgi:3',5'-cyclic AMP phosphodiesterase CpdA